MGGSRKLTYDDLAELSRRLGTMLSSGTDLAGAMARIWELERRPAVKAVYQDILIALYGGKTLSEALALQKPAFPPWMVRMVQAGEATGEMPQIFQQVSRTYAKVAKQRRKMQGACVYPCFLLILIALSLAVLFTVVLPQLFEMFDEVESLPASTRFLMAASDMLARHGYAVGLLLAACAILVAYLTSLEPVRVQADRLKLGLPFAGRWVRQVCTARFSRAFCLLYLSGASIVDAVHMAALVTGNRWLEKEAMDCEASLMDGVPLSRALEGVAGLDWKLAANVRIGEESGQVRELLLPMADQLDQEADEAIQRLTVLIEPAFILLMAVMIGVVMWSVVMPIYQYYQTLI